MYLVVGNMMKLLTFDSTKYEELVNNIEKSNGYICYINSLKDSGLNNKDYYEYLEEKQEMYTTYAVGLKQDKDRVYDQFIIGNSSDDISGSEKKTTATLQELYEKYGVSDDYILNVLEEVSLNDCNIKLCQAVPIEKEIYDITLQIDNSLESINRAQLSRDFVFNDYRRFMLIPPLIKNSEGKYETSIVLVTIYCTGIITIQLIITFTSEKLLPISENPPRSMSLAEVSLCKIKERYNKDDFWIKEKIGNLSFDQLLEYYEATLCKIAKIKIECNKKNTAFIWTIGDFLINKNSSYLGKVDDYQKTLNYYLLNSRRSIIEDIPKDNLMTNLKNALVFEHKNLTFYCSNTNAVLYVNKNKFSGLILNYLSQFESALKENNQYEAVMLEQYQKHTLVSMFELIRFYELAFIKKYYLRNLLDNINNNKYGSLDEYKKLKQEMEFLNIKFDEEFLFQCEGSPREMYRHMLENLEANLLQMKAEKLIKSFSDDIAQERNATIKQNENIIVTFSSIITIVLGYNGIKIIVQDILCNAPLVGDHITQHPLRFSTIIWGILIVIMLFFNIRRWKMNR